MRAWRTQASSRKVELHDDAKALIVGTAGTISTRPIAELHLNDLPAPSFEHHNLCAKVPAPPVNFIYRPALTEPLLEGLLANPLASMVITALEGMDGVGKSFAALSLCHDPHTQQAFPDGIIWLTFGRQSNLSLPQRIEQVASALNMQFGDYTEAAYQSMLLAALLYLYKEPIGVLHTLLPALPQVGPPRVDLPTLRLTLVPGRRLLQILPHRLAIHVQAARDLARAQPVMMQLL